MSGVEEEIKQTMLQRSLKTAQVQRRNKRDIIKTAGGIGGPLSSFAVMTDGDMSRGTGYRDSRTLTITGANFGSDEKLKSQNEMGT